MNADRYTPCSLERRRPRRLARRRLGAASPEARRRSDVFASSFVTCFDTVSRTPHSEAAASAAQESGEVHD